MPEPMHFAAPFRFDSRGHAEIVEQGSSQDIAGCIYNIALCTEGSRADLPEFGIPDPSFHLLPVDLAGIRDALERWEPRAKLTLTETAEALDIANRVITVNVS